MNHILTSLMSTLDYLELKGVEIWVIGHYCVKISIRIHLQSVKLRIHGMKRDVEIWVIGHYCVKIPIRIHLHNVKLRIYGIKIHNLLSIICHPSSVICHLSSVICHLSSNIHHLSSNICHLSSVICHLANDPNFTSPLIQFILYITLCRCILIEILTQ